MSGRRDLETDPYRRSAEPAGRRAGRSGPLGIQVGELVPWIREHPIRLAGSTYVTFAVIPAADQLVTRPRLGLCLVARTDGQWLTSPAKNSGE
jgi:hypothetical protein